MDRTSKIGILVCLVLLTYIAFFGMPKAPKNLPKAGSEPAAVTPAAVNPPSTASSPASPETPVPSTTPAVPPSVQTPIAPEQLSYLENDNIRVTLTSHGAAVKEVELKRRKGDRTAAVMLNEQSHAGIMELTGWPGADTLSFKVGTAFLFPTTNHAIPGKFAAATPIPGTITYSATLPNGVKWQRLYTLGKDYALTVQDTFTNPDATTAVVLPEYGLSVGRAEPLLGLGGSAGATDKVPAGQGYRPSANEFVYLGIGWLTTAHFHLTTLGDFNPGSVPILGIKLHEGKDSFTSLLQDPAPVRWVGAENQFFTILLTPKADNLINHVEFQCFNQRNPDTGIAPFPPGAPPDIEARAFFPNFKIPPAQSVSNTYTLYAGPKDFDRLNTLGEQQGELMNYGKFELLIVPMLTVLHFFHSFLHNYGVAIILLTLCIKIITWPLQSFANRSGKKMQAVAPKLKELQAKYKEQPEKLNSETFALYREYGVNPFGGCVPALIQMPVFFSLYYMLQNAGELRGQSFLWVHDLTQPDTVFSAALPFVLPIFNISHLILNPLPIMVTGLTMVMMRMTPQLGDPQQAKIAQFMPLIFLVFLYNFAAALSLYYVINNCVSIVQIYRNLKKPLPELKRVPKKKSIAAKA